MDHIPKSAYTLHILFLEFTDRVPPRHILFLRTLSAEGFSVESVCWRRSKVALDKEINSNPNHIVLPAGWGKASLLILLPLLWYHQFQRLKKIRPDAIFVGHFLLLPIALAWRLWAGWAKVAVIYDALEHFPQHLAGYFGVFRKVAEPIISFIENIGASLASAVLCVDSSQDQIENRFRKWNPRTLSIWNLPSLEDDPLHENVCKIKHVYTEKLGVAFVGGLMPEKGIRNALRAAVKVTRQHPEALFLFIGPMMEDPEALGQIIKNYGLQANVKFLPFMPYREMLAHLKHCKLAIAPHQHHYYHKLLSGGNGRKFFAYMQAGLAVVGPSMGEVGMAVDMADCGMLVDTNSPDSIADAVIYLLSHGDIALQLGSNGRWAFESHFNWEVESYQFLRLITNLLDK